jgi:AraC family transcriptional activator of pobA
MLLKQIKTISQYHELMGLPKPEHPLVSLINFESIRHLPNDEPLNIVIDFYTIGLKKNFNARLKYGQQEYDFNNGFLTFMSPGQVLRIEIEGNEFEHSGWLLLIHPDLLWKTPLAKTISKYDFFSYSVNEALHLSEKEEIILHGIMKSIKREYSSNIDKFTQDIIVSQIEELLNYSSRFYHRQFLTRQVVNHQILDKLEEILEVYFRSDNLKMKGLPTVQYLAGELNVSPGYLSSLLKTLTGQSTQQHIHNKLIEKAKEKLSTTALSVSEIAFDLGFEHLQSFSKLFKSKTSLSPLEFRKSFN